MEGNAAQADRAWERLAKRGWFCSLHGPNARLPWTFQAIKGTETITKSGTTRVEAVLLGAAAVEGKHA
jgi:hypothetical protein